MAASCLRLPRCSKSRQDAALNTKTNVVQKLLKRFLVTDTAKEEEKVEFQGMQMAAEGYEIVRLGYGRQWRRERLES